MSRRFRWSNTRAWSTVSSTLLSLTLAVTPNNQFAPGKLHFKVRGQGVVRVWIDSENFYRDTMLEMDGRRIEWDWQSIPPGDHVVNACEVYQINGRTLEDCAAPVVVHVIGQ